MRSTPAAVVARVSCVPLPPCPQKIGLHAAILYVKPFAHMFKVSPLSKADWVMVLAFSLPVLLLEELLKLLHRMMPSGRRATSTTTAPRRAL